MSYNIVNKQAIRKRVEIWLKNWLSDGFLWGGATAANQCEGAYDAMVVRAM